VFHISLGRGLRPADCTGEDNLGLGKSGQRKSNGTLVHGCSVLGPNNEENYSNGNVRQHFPFLPATATSTGGPYTIFFLDLALPIKPYVSLPKAAGAVGLAKYAPNFAAVSALSLKMPMARLQSQQRSPRTCPVL
jgi:hypothetical protein